MEYKEQRNELIERYKKLREDGVKEGEFSKAKMDNSFNNTEKTMKWLNIRAKWMQLHHSFEFQRMTAWKKAFEYYKTDYPFTLSTKEEYNNMIKTDPSYAEIADLASITSDIIDYIDATLDAIKSRGFEIKNYIEWQKFQHGQ